MGIESAVFFLFFAAVFILLFLAVAGAALFFRRFNENTKYIESNIRRARDKGEYSYWIRELQCHYLCLIPFVGRRNVSRVYRFIFRKPNRDKNKEYCRGIYRILAPSIIGIGICTVCLCGNADCSSALPGGAAFIAVSIFLPFHTRMFRYFPR